MAWRPTYRHREPTRDYDETVYNRSYQRALNRVPPIGAKEQRQFDITYTLLPDKAAVDKALQQVQSIEQERPTEVRKSPLVDLPKH